MKQTTPFLLIALLFVCCHNNGIKDNVSVGNLKAYFTKSILQDSSIAIDSFTLARIDTLSAKNGYIYMYNKISDLVEDNTTDAKKLQIDIDYNLSNYRLMANNPYAGSLVAVYKSDYQKDMDKLRKLIHSDSLYLVDMRRLDTIINKSDSVMPIAYAARCFYQIKNKDFSVVRDTARIRLNKDFNIISLNEYLKLLPTFTSVSEVSF